MAEQAGESVVERPVRPGLEQAGALERRAGLSDHAAEELESALRLWASRSGALGDRDDKEAVERAAHGRAGTATTARLPSLSMIERTNGSALSRLVKRGSAAAPPGSGHLQQRRIGRTDLERQAGAGHRPARPVAARQLSTLIVLVPEVHDNAVAVDHRRDRLRAASAPPRRRVVAEVNAWESSSSAARLLVLATCLVERHRGVEHGRGIAGIDVEQLALAREEAAGGRCGHDPPIAAMVRGHLGDQARVPCPPSRVPSSSSCARRSASSPSASPRECT